MTRARARYMPLPRIGSEDQVAARLGHGTTWLRDNREKLEGEGCPHVDPLLGGTDLDAVDRWLDQRCGIAASVLSDPDMEIEKWQP